jgi:pimeloyl-ACP methyl ester carboxylesterase
MMCFIGLALYGCVNDEAAIVSATAEKSSGRGTLGDGGVSDFYRYDDQIPTTPGTLLRHEPLAAHQSIAGAAKNIRLLYSSTDGLDRQTPVVVSGGLFLPQGTPPEGGWPLLLWSHGTVGIADVCAPSWTGYVPFHQEHLQRWLQNGYAIVASDYQGLGTKGTHPYLATRPEAYSNLDVVRAVQSAGFPLSREVVLVGQSQGAGAVLATAGYSAAYAPEIRLRGVVVTGVPYFTPEALVAVQQARPKDRVDPMLGYNFLVLTLVEQLDSSFDASNYVYEAALPTMRAVQSVCNRDMRKKIQQLGLTYNATFKKSPPLQQGFEMMQYPTLALSVPVFVGTGSADRDTPPHMQAHLVKTTCEAGSNVSAYLYQGYDHLSVLNHSMVDSIPFVAAVFGDAEIAGNCKNLPF